MLERRQIEDVVKSYFEGYLDAEHALVAKAFHPETRLLCVEDGRLDATSMSAWLENLTQRKAKGDLRKADCEILSVDVTQESAVVKATLSFAERRFTDYLSLLNIGGRWQIVGKIYSVVRLT